jgi:anti-sigma regulatory factor (Ser/Thr protein kinase)
MTSTTMVARTTGHDAFVHPALLYRHVDEYLAGTVPFVRDGLAADEPVMVAVPGPNLDLIRDALGADAARVQLHDMTVAGRNPGRIIPAVLLAFAEANRHRRIRVIGEPIWPGRDAEEYPACVQHEALINAAFAGRAATILCPYDAARLNPSWLRDAEQTHPTMIAAGRQWDSPHYDDPVATAAGFNRPLPDPPPDAATYPVDSATLPAIRRFITARAGAAGLVPAQVVDLTIAVNELATNIVEHTDGAGRLAMWVQDGHVVCQLHDTGRLTDPLAGRLPVPPDAPTRGRGLVLVNQLCDLVRMHTGDTGTTIRVHLRLPA